MSQRTRRKPRLSQADEEEPEEVEVSQSQSRQRSSSGSGESRRGRKRKDSDDDADEEKKSRRKKKKGDDDEGGSKSVAFDRLSSKDQERLVGDVMRVMLFKHARQMPIKQDQISKEVNIKGRCKGGLKDILNEARRRFHDLLRWELCELPKLPILELDKPQGNSGEPETNGIAAEEPEKKRGARKSTGEPTKRKKPGPKEAATGSKVFILRNPETTMAAIKKVNDLNEFADQHRGLLMVILQFVLIKDNQLSVDVLWKCLKDLGVAEDAIHPVLGNVKDLIAGFVRQGYLLKSKSEDDMLAPSQREQAVQYFYSLGPRTYKESSEFGILRTLCRVTDQPVDVTDPSIKSVLARTEKVYKAIEGKDFKVEADSVMARVVAPSPSVKAGARRNRGGGGGEADHDEKAEGTGQENAVVSRRSVAASPEAPSTRKRLQRAASKGSRKQREDEPGEAEDVVVPASQEGED